MIKKETVLVLGAGASADYGFPTGLELISKIYNLLKIDPLKEEYKRSIAFLLYIDKKITAKESITGQFFSTFLTQEINLIENFADSLLFANTSSIDDFLHRRSDFALIGKICIYIVISKLELTEAFGPMRRKNPDYDPLSSKKSEKKLYISDYEIRNGWYSYLWKKLYENGNKESTLTKMHQNKLKVVTFNYDRSLEYFLFNSAKSLFNKSKDETMKFVASVPILHVYGKLGSLDIADEDNSDALLNIYGGINILGITKQFDLSNNIHGINIGTSSDQMIDMLKHILVISKGINTYTQTIENKDSETYLNLLKNADSIYFLGFGYHETNLDALNLYRTKSILKADIFGTSYGLRAAETNLISKNLHDFSEKKHSGNMVPYINPHYSHYKIQEYIQEVAPIK